MVISSFCQFLQRHDTPRDKRGQARLCALTIAMKKRKNWGVNNMNILFEVWAEHPISMTIVFFLLFAIVTGAMSQKTITSHLAR
jgi:hypothetical protein